MIDLLPDLIRFTGRRNAAVFQNNDVIRNLQDFV